MARLIALLVVLAAASVQGTAVEDKAQAWLKAELLVHQIPQESDLDVLRQADPATFEAVRGLLNKQALGTLGEKNSARAPAKLSAEQMKQFTYSKATQDRKNVLALEAQMFKQQQQFAAVEDSKATKISKVLSGEVKAEKPKPKPVFRKPAAPVEEEKKVYVPEMEALEDPAPKRKQLAAIAAASKTSWGFIKNLAKAAKTGATEHKKVAAPRGPSLGWGSILKNMHRTQQEQLTGKHSALASFSWGDDEAVAHGEADAEEKKPELSNLSVSRVPSEIDTLAPSDQLEAWMGSGKKQAAPAAPAVSEHPLTESNPYSMDLN